MVHAGLLAWIAKQSDWAKDALRRHALSPNYELGPADKADIVRRVKAACDIAQDGDCELTPVTADHLDPQVGGTPGALFVAMGPVQNVARLAEGQRLSFALDGITLIYGDNGTGKSGYCRIAKRLCRSPTTDDLIGDVSVAGRKPPAQVQVDHKARDEEEPTSVTWTDGATPPAEIASISVFDSKNARVYIDKENKIGFLPREIAILEQHAKNRAEMAAQFNAEIAVVANRIRVPLPSDYAPDGDAAKLLRRLEPKTELPSKDEIETAAQWEAAHEERLAELSALLKQDPETLADTKCRIAVAVRDQADKLTAADTALSQIALDEIVSLAESVRTAEETARLSADTLFSDTPIPGVGQEPWRAMYRHAEAYVVATGFAEHLPQDIGEACALCQQPLTEDGAVRMARFRQFMTDAVTTQLAAAQEAFQACYLAVEGISFDEPDRARAMLAELKLSGEEGALLTEDVADWSEAMDMRRAAVLAAFEDRNFEAIPCAPETITARMADLAERLDSEAEALTRTAEGDAAALAAQRKEMVDLEDRKRLARDLEAILMRLADLQENAKLAECKEEVATGSTSTQITSLRKDLVSGELVERVKVELETLDLMHLPFKITERSAGGQSNFKIVIDTPVSVPNEQVLSEGEQRALALACFLGELGGDDKKNGIIVDDPVSSLDHIRIRRVARRLVAEAAKGRQVILFTHNLLFYNEIADAAAAISPPVPVAKRIVRKEEERGFGVISDDDEPWIAQGVNERITRLQARLKELEGRKDAGTDPYRRAVKDFYTDLRETWERLVEELLLGKVVERFNTDVKTMSLKGVMVEDDDYQTIYWAMKGASERSGHDMGAGKQLGDPSHEDMKAALTGLEVYKKKIGTRRKDAETRRKALEEPPAAQTQ
jgi:hypothetical protein